VRALLDTSYFIGEQTGRPMARPAGLDATEVSVATLAELTIGVLRATEENRAARLATLSRVEANWQPLGIDAEVARTFARIVADLRGRGRRAPVLDLLVAATAMVEGIPVVTQDRDYDAIEGLTVIRL
jgi:predicted nucleic acid-binding protein